MATPLVNAPPTALYSNNNNPSDPTRLIEASTDGGRGSLRYRRIFGNNQFASWYSVTAQRSNAEFPVDGIYSDIVTGKNWIVARDGAGLTITNDFGTPYTSPSNTYNNTNDVVQFNMTLAPVTPNKVPHSWVSAQFSMIAGTTGSYDGQMVLSFRASYALPQSTVLAVLYRVG